MVIFYSYVSLPEGIAGWAKCNPSCFNIQSPGIYLGEQEIRAVLIQRRLQATKMVILTSKHVEQILGHICMYIHIC